MKHNCRRSHNRSRGSQAGYVFAALMAIQPFINDEVDFSRRSNLVRFVFRICLAVVVAVLSRYTSVNPPQSIEKKNPGLPH
ncbi:MAG TPA: hypothetical protein VNR87_00340 [Flavisolibacter sp.]|nr:hypothetical protein [Flavisolibacter sp.]